MGQMENSLAKSVVWYFRKRDLDVIKKNKKNKSEIPKPIDFWGKIIFFVVSKKMLLQYGLFFSET